MCRDDSYSAGSVYGDPIGTADDTSDPFLYCHKPHCA